VLRELTGLVAARADDARGETSESTIPAEVADLLPMSQVEAFERQGWRFLPSSTRASPADTPPAKVYLGRGDRVLLGTNTLTIKLPSEPASEAEANALLAPFNCRVVERLPFSRGLYRVTVDPASARDAIDVANELAASGLVEFSEPELTEAIGPRSPSDG